MKKEDVILIIFIILSVFSGYFVSIMTYPLLMSFLFVIFAGIAGIIIAKKILK